MTRRAAMGAIACACASGQPVVTMVTGAPGAAVPDGFAADASVFMRAYAACPEPAGFRSSLVTGCFPHKRNAAAIVSLNGAARIPEGPATVLYVSKPDGETPFERSMHIAMAIRHPRLARGRRFDFPVSTVDVAATLVALNGGQVPEGVHGRDLSALLVSGAGERPEAVFAEGNLNRAEEWRMLVRGMDKIVARPSLDVLHLFNLADDPEEEHDLAREIGYRLKIDELTALVHAWMKRTGDGMDPSGLKRR